MLLYKSCSARCNTIKRPSSLTTRMPLCHVRGRRFKLSCGNSSAVEHRLAKARVDGSNPFSRSILPPTTSRLPGVLLWNPATRISFPVCLQPLAYPGGPQRPVSRPAKGVRVQERHLDALVTQELLHGLQRGSTHHQVGLSPWLGYQQEAP